MVVYPRADPQSIDGRLYADAGVIAYQVEVDGRMTWVSNPSPVGLVWAWVLVAPDDETELARASGYLLTPLFYDKQIWPAKTDLAEFLALSCGLSSLPHGWNGEVLTDNVLTIRRMFEGWPCRSLPPSWVKRAAIVRERLGRLTPVHLNGHPTREDLELGYRKHPKRHRNRGDPPPFAVAAEGSVPARARTPVSRWNVLVDSLCNQEKPKALEAFHARQVPTTRPQHTPDGATPSAEAVTDQAATAAG